MTANQNSYRRPPRIFVLILAFLLLPIAQVHAADIAVSATCSLADAITSANTDTATGGCTTAGNGADKITFTGTDIYLTAKLPDIRSDITIDGDGWWLSQADSDYAWQGPILRTRAGSKLTLQNLTLDSGGGGNAVSPLAAVELGDDATFRNMDLNGCYRLCVRGRNSGATYTFENVLFEFGFGALFTPAAIWADRGTYNLTNTGFDSMRQGGESLIRVSRGAQVNLSGCLYIRRVLPKLQSGDGTLINSSSGDCIGATTIGNRTSPPEGQTDEDENACGLYESWPLMSSVSARETRTIVLSQDCDIGAVAHVPHNLDLTVTSPANARYTIYGELDNQIFLVGGKLTLRKVDLVARDADPPQYTHSTDAIQAFHAEAITLNDVTISPDSSSPRHRSGLFLVNVGATTLTQVTIRDHTLATSEVDGSALTLYGKNNVRITDSTFSNNQGGVGAILVRHASGRVHLAGTNTFTGNNPLDIRAAYNTLTACAGCLPENVEYFGTPPSEDTEEESTGRRRASTPEVKATAVPVHTCLSLPANIAVRATFGLSSGIQCRQLAPWQTELPGALDAVDLWAYVEQGAEVCFLGSGRLVFLDAAYAPRLVSDLPAYGRNGMTCAEIDRPGSVVLMPGPPAPLQTVETANTASSHLQGCMVTTNYILNFRASPAGEVLGLLPYGVTLTALERVPGWFKVDYHGAQGWISADYVEPKGHCG